MQYTTKYETPLGSVLLAADETGLTGLWFDGAGYYAAGLAARHEEKEVPVFEKVRTWLDLYFSGKQPECLPPLHMIGSPFRIRVWEMLLQIPYGQTMTYGELAAQIAKERGSNGCRHRLSAGRWRTIRSPFSFRVTGWWERTAA